MWRAALAGGDYRGLSPPKAESNWLGAILEMGDPAQNLELLPAPSRSSQLGSGLQKLLTRCRAQCVVPGLPAEITHHPLKSYHGLLGEITCFGTLSPEVVFQ